MEKTESHYQRQLNYIFNRPTTEPAWYWSECWEEGVFDDPMQGFTFMESLLAKPKTDLEPFSDDQIGQGLNFIFNNSCSNLSHDFKDAAVLFERREKVLRSLFNLFKDVLDVRCEHKTAAFSQEKSSYLNGICYMFWDVTPLSVWSGFPKIEKRGYDEAMIAVMAQCLTLDNPACVESALHGLGHAVTILPKMAIPVIDEFLKKHKNKGRILLNYAEMARTGMIL